jgi:hypothetical protein
VPWDVYIGLGNKFLPATETDSVPEIKEQTFARAETGFPTTNIRKDDDWDVFLNECYDILCISEAAWTLRGAQAPSVFDVAGIRKNLESQQKKCGIIKNMEAFDDGFLIVLEALVDAGCNGFRELSEREAWCGSDDGMLQPMNMRTSLGALLSRMGRSKQIGMENAGAFIIEICRYDKRMTADLEGPMVGWLSKTSLKDARLGIDKLAEGKMRIFQAQAMPVTVTGRQLLGDFLARFMRACKDGGFVGIIGMVMARGGWHELLRDLSFDFSVDEVDSGDVSKWDKDWLHFFHWMLCLLMACLAGTEDLAQQIARHYDRVVRSPTHLAIVGLIFILLKGQPSGDVATIVFNTIVQWFMYAYAYCTLVPKEFRNYKDMQANVRLKLGGDDSVSCLSSNMRGFLAGRSWPDHVAAIFAEPGWKIILVTTPLSGIEFMGYHTIVADCGASGKWHIPVLPFTTIQSINEWMKKGKRGGTPDAVRSLARYYASVEKSFPLLFSKDRMHRRYARLTMTWLDRIRKKYWDSPNEEIRNAARGIPTLMSLAQLYFPVPIPMHNLLKPE